MDALVGCLLVVALGVQAGQSYAPAWKWYRPAIGVVVLLMYLARVESMLLWAVISGLLLLATGALMRWELLTPGPHSWFDAWLERSDARSRERRRKTHTCQCPCHDSSAASVTHTFRCCADAVGVNDLPEPA